VNLTFAGVRADDVLLLLDAAGFDASTGSACTAGVHQPSEVLLAMGRTLDDASASLRFSFGPDSSAETVDALLAVLPGVVERARAAA
jgi:cysteine desulfurase